MSSEEGKTDEGQGQEEGRHSDDGANEGQGNEGQGEGGSKEGGKEPTFSQEQVDSIVKKRLAKQEARFQAELDEMKSTQGKTDVEKLNLQLENAKAKTSTLEGKIRDLTVANLAQMEAIRQGVPVERLERFVRLLDLTDVDAEDVDALPSVITTAVESVLEEVPEFKPSDNGGGDNKGIGKGASGGDFSGKKGAKVWTREEVLSLAKTDPAKYAEHRDEIHEQMEAGLIK